MPSIVATEVGHDIADDRATLVQLPTLNGATETTLPPVVTQNALLYEVENPAVCRSHFVTLSVIGCIICDCGLTLGPHMVI